MASSSRRGSSRSRRVLIIFVLSFLLSGVYYFRQTLHTSWRLAAFEIVWSRDKPTFMLSDKDDLFDVTMDAYPQDAQSAAPFEDRVPARIHHVNLGRSVNSKLWEEGRKACLDLHPDWESYMWTDENAETFVKEQFPHMLDLWRGYKYPVERVDALRYMVLYWYGGVVLDMDLQCSRALGPLRRFDFVAPEAYPQGFSIGFMMASRQNKFVGELVRNLQEYNKQWFALPYPTVMFSTGCHYASTIHAYQPNRTELKILPGPLHSLNGAVTTPLFKHLGSSSWHDYDARVFAMVPHYGRQVAFIVVVALLLLRYARTRRTIEVKRVEKDYEH